MYRARVHVSRETMRFDPRCSLSYYVDRTFRWKLRLQHQLLRYDYPFRAYGRCWPNSIRFRWKVSSKTGVHTGEQ